MTVAADQRLLFSPFALGRITLANRVVMAPMTRSRATLVGNRPGPLALTYYVQRASAGLIIAEGTQFLFFVFFVCPWRGEYERRQPV